MHGEPATCSDAYANTPTQAQFWNSLPSATVSVQLDLHGLSISHGGGLTIRGGGPYGKIQVSSSVRPEELKPSVSFSK